MRRYYTLHDAVGGNQRCRNEGANAGGAESRPQGGECIIALNVLDENLFACAQRASTWRSISCCNLLEILEKLAIESALRFNAKDLVRPEQLHVALVGPE